MMATMLWNRVRGGGTGVRALAAYVVLALVVALIVPVLPAYGVSQAPDSNEVKIGSYPGDGTHTYNKNSPGIEVGSDVPDDWEIVLFFYKDAAGDEYFYVVSSKYPVTSAEVKGGPVANPPCTYSPPLYGEPGMHAPENPDNVNRMYYGISHIIFTFDVPDDPETGSILVKKYDDANGDRDITGDSLLTDVFFSFTITDGQGYSETKDTDSSGTVLFDGLDPQKTYTVTETAKTGWTCTIGAGGFSGIAVVAGETTEVIFANYEDPGDPETGSILVKKYDDANGDGDIAGDSLLTDVFFSFTITDGQGYSETKDTDSSGTVLFDGLDPQKTYTVTETAKTGWTCTIGAGGFSGIAVVAGETTEVVFANAASMPYTELDLAITKKASVHDAAPGDLVTYTLTWENLGNEAAENYTIVDDYDERYVTIVNASGGTVDTVNGTITWTFAGPLAPEDGKQTLTYTVRIITDMPNGTTHVDNVVEISHPDDSDPSNNIDDERVDVGPYLPYTGGEYTLLLSIAFAAAAAGLLLRFRAVRMS